MIVYHGRTKSISKKTNKLPVFFNDASMLLQVGGYLIVIDWNQ